jgi:hypothetical protein
MNIILPPNRLGAFEVFQRTSRHQGPISPDSPSAAPEIKKTVGRGDASAVPENRAGHLRGLKRLNLPIEGIVLRILHPEFIRSHITEAERLGANGVTGLKSPEEKIEFLVHQTHGSGPEPLPRPGIGKERLRLSPLGVPIKLERSFSIPVCSKDSQGISRHLQRERFSLAHQGISKDPKRLAASQGNGQVRVRAPVTLLGPVEDRFEFRSRPSLRFGKYRLKEFVLY